MLFRTYLDDSEHDSTKLFGVGGFVGPDAEWGKLEGEWLSALPKGIQYFHATDCFSGKDQFEPSKGFGIPERTKILDTLTDLICQSDIKLICHTFDYPKYANFAPKRIENAFLGNKYCACFEATIQSTCRDYMQPSHSPHPVETGDVCAIFYEGSEYSDSVQRALRNMRENEYLWWRKRVGNAAPGTKTGPASIPLLQVADLGAFLGTKHVADSPNARIPWRPYYQKLQDARKIFACGKISKSSLGFLWALFNTQRHPESDFFRVRVRGEFPIQGNAQFISSAAVEQARHAQYPALPHLPKILVCDPARFGEDESVIGLRQGRAFRILETFHEKPTDFTGERVIHWIHREKPDAVVIDETGLDAGVVDHVRNRGFNQSNGYLVVGFNGGADPIDGKMYYNRRAEVWGSAKEWLEAGASIPDDPELAADLTSVAFDYSRLKVRHGSIILESKDDMKRRGLRSPDKGDTLAMSFAVQLAPRPKQEEPQFGSWAPSGDGSWMR